MIEERSSIFFCEKFKKQKNFKNSLILLIPIYFEIYLIKYLYPCNNFTYDFLRDVGRIKKILFFFLKISKR